MSSFNPGLVFRYLLAELRYFPAILKSFSGQTENSLNRALATYFKIQYPDTEKSEMAAIETIRRKWLQSTAHIPVTEFGQGSNILSKTAKSEKIADICRIMSKSEAACRFLYALIKTIKPGNSIELGSCLGISAAYMGMALRQNGNGMLSSFEGSPDRAKIAVQNINELNMAKQVIIVVGKFQETLPAYLKSLSQLEFAFIDGHHQEQATIDYFNLILPKYTHGGIMVFDDIFWSAGMYRAWKTIKNNPNVTDSIVFRGMGIVQIKA